MIFGVKNDRHAGPLQWLLGIERWFRRSDLTRPLLELAVRGVQRGSTIDAHGLHSFLELALARLVVLIMIIIFLLLITALSGPLLLIIVAAATSLAAMLLAGTLSTILTLLLVPPFIFSFLVFSKQLNLSAVLEVMALGAVDLAVLLVGAVLLVDDCHSLVVGACDNLLAGSTSFYFLGATSVAGLLND